VKESIMPPATKTSAKPKASEGSHPSRKHHHRAVAALKRDARLAAIIAIVGPYRPSPAGDRFFALVRAIVSQQVSKYAAEAILARLLALFPGGVPEAKALLKLRTPKLLGVGLSRRKVEYLRDLATHVADGRIDFATLDRLGDEEVIERLTAVKGIGRWTAEMYLLFTLGRPDILPLGDVALVNAVRDIYALPADADAAHFGTIAENWRPWRSVACWYLYRSINMRRAAAKESAKLAKRAAAAAAQDPPR
jgi:DNA-3-methyladenine glycosylase II